MSYNKTISLHKELISRDLSQLIDSNYWLLEVPYYENVGDTLIWQGEMDLLRTLPYKCKGMFSSITFPFPEISPDDILLFQGGGNFGDLWHGPHEFRMKVVSHYPNNRCIIFPQTVFFEKEENLLSCADFYSRYDKVTICARDQWSYDLLKKHFTNNVLLVPDMAFCINVPRTLSRFCQKSDGGDLLVKRIDKELKPSGTLSELEDRNDIAISDWPSYLEPISWQTKKLYKLIRARFRGHCRLLDLYAKYVYRRYLIRTGVELLSKYDHIYTTRLHAAILGVMLGKQVTILDNSYGKNSHFYETWLSDCDKVSLMK